MVGSELALSVVLEGGGSGVGKEEVYSLPCGMHNLISYLTASLWINIINEVALNYLGTKFFFFFFDNLVAFNFLTFLGLCFLF